MSSYKELSTEQFDSIWIVLVLTLFKNKKIPSHIPPYPLQVALTIAGSLEPLAKVISWQKITRFFVECLLESRM